MSFNDYELSVSLGSRVEMFLFETDDGRYRWSYTTDHVSKFIGPQEYVPTPIKRSELAQRAGDSGEGRLTITVPYDNPVAVAHVPYLPPRPIKVTIYAYHRDDPAQQIVSAFTGYITSFTQKGVEAELECSQIIDTMQQTVPWIVFKPGCVYSLYQVGCGVDKALFRDEALLSAVVADTLSSAQFSARPDGWYRSGIAVDEDTGEQRFITAHDATAGTIKIVYPFSNNVVGSSTIAVYAGCDRSSAMCIDKFDNKINRLAFDHFPEYNVFQQGVT